MALFGYSTGRNLLIRISRALEFLIFNGLYLTAKRNMQYCSVYITARDELEARKLGIALVTEKLVACVNIFPIQSIYRWQGKVEKSHEVAIIAKSRMELVDRITARVKQLHSYKVPCVVALPIEKGNPDYLKWIGDSTG